MADMSCHMQVQKRNGNMQHFQMKKINRFFQKAMVRGRPLSVNIDDLNIVEGLPNTIASTEICKYLSELQHLS